MGGWRGAPSHGLFQESAAILKQEPAINIVLWKSAGRAPAVGGGSGGGGGGAQSPPSKLQANEY